MSNTPQLILQLVETFDRNIDNFKKQNYNEAQVRQQFINPFFEALGWDMQNKAGIALAYSDVIHEDAIKVGGSTKAPDYCFRVGGTKKFFVEAKKPSVDIKSDISPAYQLRRYAWSAKLPLSILTDFEEFAVYDCQVRPNVNDKPSTARIFYCTYKEYGEKWEQIANIFGKDAVYKGLFDTYASEKTTKRGTTTVDKEFLAEIEGWRNELAKNIAIRNGKLSVYDLNFAVQKTIDRILFLRICEDRGIERSDQLLGLINGSRIYPRLFELFEKSDERYNSGIFHFHREKDRPESPDELSANLKVDDDVLKKMIKDLYYPCPYEFSIMPAEILGNVYEQFLGKVIRLTASHQAKVEEKPEVKKAGGVYYTPSYIVDYIVKNTVGKLCEGKTPKQIEKLKILDPACGSGSFLIGAYQYLLDFHRDYYAEEPARHKKAIYQGKGKQWFLTIDEKKRILLNNIYGVDIDSQAVEVTKLSLLLKVLENETQESLRLFHERALPDLGNNIKCGNSLIGPDFYHNQQLNLFDDQQQRKINAFDWQKEFAEIFKKGGFDAVIGNPPYVIISNDFYSQEELRYLNHYQVAQYKTDLFHLFIEKGVRLLCNDGYLGFIVPNPWLTLKFTDILRKYILENTCIKELVLLKNLVFQDANVYTALLFLSKHNPKKNIAIIKRIHETTNVFEILNSTGVEMPQQDWLESERCAIEVRRIGRIGSIVNKIIKGYPKLEKIARASLGCQAYNSSKHTAEQIKNRVFHAVTKQGKDYLPELAGKDVGRYFIIRQKGQWIKYGPWLHDYRTMDWLEGPRILIREIVGSGIHKIQACYVEKTYCNYKTILNINPADTTTVSMKYLTGIVNSSLMSFVYPFMSNKMIAQSFPRITVGDLRKLPIRPIDFSKPEEVKQHDRMVSLVEQMLELNKKLTGIKNPDEKTRIQRQIDATDSQIDKLVYDLYGLTPDEIAIVEGNDLRGK
jgi:type I restriction-modification system DNA methylase subunit